MKKIKPEELPSVLTDEVIDVLARMADEVPQSSEWHEIFNLLTPIDYRRVMDRKNEFQQQEENSRITSMTIEQNLDNKRKTNFSSFNGESKGSMWSYAVGPDPNEYQAISNFEITESNINTYVQLKKNGWVLGEFFYSKLHDFLQKYYMNRFFSFNGNNSILGLSYQSNFKRDGREFKSILQYLVFEKADFFVYPEILSKVLETNDPIELERLSKEIPYHMNGSKAWSNYFKMILMYGLNARYDADPVFRKELLSTSGSKLICNCNSYKLGVFQHEGKESGLNLLGRYLTLVRVQKSGKLN